MASDDDDDDEDAEFPRKNIDFIELSSDENEAESAPRSHGNMPVRIGRKPHKKKEFGINTDASTDVSTSATTMPTDAAKGSRWSATDASHKGKGIAKEVEITGMSKKYKGMWQDSESGGDDKIKTEFMSSDDEAATREQVGIDTASVKVEQSPERERKPKLPSNAMPSFQTEEERQEWERIQFNLLAIKDELGTVEATMAEDGDTNMSDVVEMGSKASVRDGHTYLFQLPPTMPELLEPGQSKPKPKPEASEAQPPPLQAAANGEAAIKMEEEFSDPRANKGTGPRFASGRVGKLRVHKSGRTTLDWGGISFEVGPGIPASFLQEVVSLEVIPADKRVVPEDAGEALSFGRIKEKFVVTPNWEQLLG